MVPKTKILLIDDYPKPFEVDELLKLIEFEFRMRPSLLGKEPVNE